MRLLIVGTLRGELITAAKIARERGASVAQVDGVEAALSHLRQGKGADLLMVDVQIDIRALCEGLSAEHMNAPIVACGVSNDKRAAVMAIDAGAKEYIPLPPDPDLIAAILEAVIADRDLDHLSATRAWRASCSSRSRSRARMPPCSSRANRVSARK